MLRRLLIVTLVAVAFACVVKESVAICRHCRHGAVMDYLFGGYSYGPFGYGEFSYAGYSPPTHYTECGRRIR